MRRWHRRSRSGCVPSPTFAWHSLLLCSADRFTHGIHADIDVEPNLLFLAVLVFHFEHVERMTVYGNKRLRHWQADAQDDVQIEIFLAFINYNESSLAGFSVARCKDRVEIR